MALALFALEFRWKSACRKPLGISFDQDLTKKKTRTSVPCRAFGNISVIPIKSSDAIAIDQGDT